MLTSTGVAIAHKRANYPSCAPFRPAPTPPELVPAVTAGAEENPIHELVRTLLASLSGCAGAPGSPDWNPLGHLIHPGQRVLIKPNLVRHAHATGGDYRAVVTHGSVVRAIADYVGLALRGEGQIAIGDAPVQGTDFDAVVARTGLRDVCEDLTACWGVPVRLADFRLWALQAGGHTSSEVGGDLSGDVEGYCAVDLGHHSMLGPLDEHAERFSVTCYDPDEMRIHHGWHRHEYLVAKAVLNADVVINVPKLKTHAKVGLTAALKNLVGINGYKDWLPHHRSGAVDEGGDEYLAPSRLKRLQTSLDGGIYRHRGSPANGLRRLGVRTIRRLNRHLAKDDFYEGSWYGNDTCWRMVLDLNRILLYADREGAMTDALQRRTLTVVDGVVAGEGNGPMAPDARACNVLVAGENPAAVDAVLATLIGFDFRKLPLISNAFSLDKWPLADLDPASITVSSNEPRFERLRVGKAFDGFPFQPPSSWVGHVEMATRDEGVRAQASGGDR